MFRTWSATALIIGVASIAASHARAAVMTETYTFPSPLQGYTRAVGTSFAEFNPALGTLDSITLNDSATATFFSLRTGGPSSGNSAVYQISLNGLLFFMDADQLRDGPAEASISNLNETDPIDLSALTGTGVVSTSVIVANAVGTFTTVSSTFGTESLTYNYTPTASIPEPGALVLLSIGLIGCAVIRWRR
jgi:PEP-CTERM motif